MEYILDRKVVTHRSFTRRAFLQKTLQAALAAGVIAADHALPLSLDSVQATPNPQGRVTIELATNPIRAGRAALVYVRGGSDVAAVRGIFQGRLFHFFGNPATNEFTGFLTVDMETPEVGTYPLQVWVEHADGSLDVMDQSVEVVAGEFGSTPVKLSAALTPLLEPEVEAAEMERLFNVMERFTPERYWEPNGFIIPSPGPQIGYFGTWRLYNDTYWRRHTGLDVSLPVGTSIHAVANGRVMLAEELAIRGGYVLLDHGWGVYSGYAHLSEKTVVPGQWVRQGDVIALSGLNGRSAGAHLHWEMVVSSTWAHPEDFMALPIFRQNDSANTGTTPTPSMQIQ